MNDNIIDAEYNENPNNLPIEIETDNPIDVEYAYARHNIVTIMEEAIRVLKITGQLAVDSDHPQIIREFDNLARTCMDLNKEILNTREKKMKIKGELQEIPTAPKKIVNNAIFVGSTEELLKKLKES